MSLLLALVNDTWMIVSSLHKGVYTPSLASTTPGEHACIFQRFRYGTEVILAVLHLVEYGHMNV
jgi:hypothetical protein